MTGCSLKLKPGFFLSNEPGYYKEGDFGIRLENILEVIPASKLVDLYITSVLYPILHKTHNVITFSYQYIL